MLDTLFGEGQSGLKILFFVIVVLVLLGLAFWLLRRFGGGRLGGGAHDILLNHDVGRPPDDEKMLDVVAADKDEAAPAVDRCLVDHGEPRLTAARCAVTQPPGAEPAQQPERQPEQDEHHDHEEEDLEAALSFAK